MDAYGFDNKSLSQQNNPILTLVISTGDAVLHFAVEPRVFIAGSQGPDPRSWLALSDFEGSFIGFGKSGCHIVHIEDINQHLKREQEWLLNTSVMRELTDCDMCVEEIGRKLALSNVVFYVQL